MDLVGNFLVMALVIMLVSVSTKLSISSSVTAILLIVVLVIVERMAKLMSIQSALWNSCFIIHFII